MQFIYHPNAGEQNLTIDGELHKYIFKVRRYDSSSSIYFRNLNDNNIYEYSVQNIDRRKANLEFVKSEEKIVLPQKTLHIGWCVIDPKSVEKQIASLNEIGVSKITFIYCEYSQKQYKLNFEKLEKLLINSSQQSGRSNIIQLGSMNSLDEFIQKYPDTYMFNFSSNHIQDKKNDINTIVLGCEGGFSMDEVNKFDDSKIVGVDSSIIQRSETAIGSLSSLILL
jgi:16S rRNA (uracil1498-N3)-methyltransferase